MLIINIYLIKYILLYKNQYEEQLSNCLVLNKMKVILKECLSDSHWCDDQKSDQLRVLLIPS